MNGRGCTKGVASDRRGKLLCNLISNLRVCSISPSVSRGFFSRHCDICSLVLRFIYTRSSRKRYTRRRLTFHSASDSIVWSTFLSTFLHRTTSIISQSIYRTSHIFIYLHSRWRWIFNIRLFRIARIFNKAFHYILIVTMGNVSLRL